MTTKVYAYTVKKIIEGETLVTDEIYRAHQHYNRLIELHRNYKQARHDALKEAFPLFEQAEADALAASAKVDEILDGIRRLHAIARSKKQTPEKAEKVAALKDAKAKRKTAWEAFKAIRADVNASPRLAAVLGGLKTLYFGEGGLFKAAYAESQAFWATKNCVSAAVEMAMKKSLGPPRFKAFDGSGKVAIQVQYNKSTKHSGSWQELERGQFRDVRVIETQTRGRNRSPIVTVEMRVGIDAKTTAKLLVAFHRPLPVDAKIMGIALVGKRLVPYRQSDGSWKYRYDWQLQFTVRTNTTKPRADSGACGIDVGWPKTPDGSLRVALWAGSDGESGELHLPDALMVMRERAFVLQGERDVAFNAMLEKVIDWRKATDRPEWFTEATKTIAHWRAKGKLVRLSSQWRSARIDGDENIFALLEIWRETDARLWQEQEALEKRFVRRRRELYRRFAAKMRRSYRTIFVKDAKLKKQAQATPAEKSEVDLSKAQMRAASVGLLVGLLVNDGATKCEAKGMGEDAVHSLLAMAEEAEGRSGETVAPAQEKYVGRFARRKADRSRKDDAA
jgi:hypothetical protein